MLLKEDQFERTRDEQRDLEPALDNPGVTEETRGAFWHAVGRLRTSERRWPDAEAVLRRAR